MRQKRILINACMIADQPSGVGIYSIELLKELVPKLESDGLNYTIYCYNKIFLKEVKTRSFKKISLGFFFDKLLKKQQTIHRHIWNIVVLNFLASKYDILYSFSSHGAIFHRRQIITIHDLICLSFPDSHKSQYYYFKLFLPILLKSSPRIIAVSNFTKSEILKNYSIKDDKVAVIYNGVNHLEKFRETERDEDLWNEEITKGKPYCLVVGASYVHKNIDTVLEVCERMKDKAILFLIVNRPTKYSNSLKKKADDLQLNNVVFIEYIKDVQLANLYRKARLNIYISLYEGFGFPPSEAAFFKTQSLLSDRTALVEIYGKDFEYCNPYDFNEIQKIVLKYIEAENKIETNAYFMLKQKYNWKKAAEEVVILFKTSIDEHYF